MHPSAHASTGGAMLADAGAVEYYLSLKGKSLYAAPRRPEGRDEAARRLAEALLERWDEVVKALSLEEPGAREAAADYFSDIVRVASGDPSGLRLAADLMQLARYVPLPVYVGGRLYYMYRPTPEEVSRVEAVDFLFIKELLDPHVSFSVERGEVRFGNRVVARVDEITGARVASIMADTSLAASFILQAALRQLEAFGKQLPGTVMANVHEAVVAVNLDKALPREARGYIESAYIVLNYVNEPIALLDVTYSLPYLGLRDRVEVPLGALYPVTAGADLSRHVEEGVRLVAEIADRVRRVDREASRLGVRDVGVLIGPQDVTVYKELYIRVDHPAVRDSRSALHVARYVESVLSRMIEARGVGADVSVLPGGDGFTVVVRASSRDGEGAVSRVARAAEILRAGGAVAAREAVERFAEAAAALYARYGGEAPRWVVEASRSAPRGAEPAGDTYMGVPVRLLTKVVRPGRRRGEEAEAA